jgi:hypothetical protein
MKIISSLTFLAFTFCAAVLDTAWAQPLTVTTIAGQFQNSTSQNGVGTNALFLSPGGIAADQAGNLYVIDNDAIRKISPNLTVNTIAGFASFGGYSDASTNALFQDPWDLAVDKNGYIYVADWGNNVVRKISPLGVVTTLAGNGTYGYIDATGTNAEFSNIYGIAVDSSGNVYVGDVSFLPPYTSQLCLIRKITPGGVVSTLAGGAQGYNDGVGAGAHFYSPQGLAVDAGGTVYVADDFGIRKVSPDGTVTTWAGSQNNKGTELDGIGANAGFYGARGIALNRSGGAYVADANGKTIRFVSSAGVVSTVAGLANQAPTTNYNDGVGSDARFKSPYGIAVGTAGNVFITDKYANTVLGGVPPSLPAIGSFTESAGVTPIRSNNPWVFAANYTTLVSDLKLRVQSTTTTNVESSWTDLPGNPAITHVDTTWTFKTTDVPTGVRYFRVVASAPGYVDSPPTLAGPETVLDGIAPLVLRPIYTATIPFQTGNLWVFNITEPSVIPGLTVRIQSSHDGGTNWNDLPGGQMTRYGSTWALNATNVPIGEISFRGVASAPTYVDRISTDSPTLDIEGLLPVVTKTISAPGRHILSLDDIPEMKAPDPLLLYVQAINLATLNLIFFGGTIDQFTAALAVAGEQYLSAAVTIGPGQKMTSPGLTVGAGGAAFLQGTHNGPVLTAPHGVVAYDPNTGRLIAQDGSALIGNDGSSLVGNDGSSLVGNDGSSLIAQDGSSMIGNDGSSLTGQAGAAVSVKSKKPLTPSPKSPTPTQPTFTGQMTINGNFYQFGGTLMIGIAGTNTLDEGAQQFDQLVVSGTAYLTGGGIAFELFNPDDQTNRNDIFQPADGATFDVVVASNIVASAVHIRGPVWGDGLFFSGSVVTRDDGLQAVRLKATHIPPQIFLQNAGPELHMVYGTNYTGYTVQSSTNLSGWNTFSTGTNVVALSPTNASQFFRLSKP